MRKRRRAGLPCTSRSVSSERGTQLLRSRCTTEVRWLSAERKLASDSFWHSRSDSDLQQHACSFQAHC